MTRTVLFVCEHGAFRSRIAAAYFNAAAPKGWRAVSAGRDPQAEVSARLEPLLAGTAAAEHLENGPPRGVDAVLPDHLIAIDCALDGADLWVTEATADPALRDEIAERTGRLVRELAAGPMPPREPTSTP